MKWNLVPGSVLTTNQFLKVGDYLQSPNKTCFAVMQSDGNFCVYAGPDPMRNRGYVWSCNSVSHPQGEYIAIQQGDGNFCVYSGSQPTHEGFIWCWSGKSYPSGDYFAELDDHGRFSVHAGTPAAPGELLWSNFGTRPGERIEHLVVLMLENRGFDSVLGFLYTPDDPPAIHEPPLKPGDVPFLGLAFEPGKPQSATVDGKVIVRTPSRGVAGANSPGFDPGEEYEHCNMQLFRKETEPQYGTAPGMDGFLEDFWKVLDGESHPLTDKVQVLETLPNAYASWDLPNLSRLARTYGVSDRWFSSVPTQTNANRAFSLCGSSQGLVNNGYVGGPYSLLGVDTFEGLRTIFNVLSDHGMNDWGIYYNELYPTASSCYTELAFPEIAKAPGGAGRFHPISQFLAQARSGTLPRFTYIEPKWGGAVLDQQIYVDGNDYHPPVNVTHSEQMLKEIYRALTANRAAWSKTLFVIMFDEHGGTYDHLAPPWGAVPPWGSGAPQRTQFEFRFKRFGVRVPNLFISPFVGAQTVIRSPSEVPFDHTAMLASVLDWCGIDRRQAGLGARVEAAPTFWKVLNQPLPRTIDNAFPVVPAPANGTPIHWGQRFYLEHAPGICVAAKEWWGIPVYSGWYPTAGKNPVALELRAAFPGNGYRAGTTLPPGGPYRIRSDESDDTIGAEHEPEWYDSLFVNKGRPANAIWYGCTDVTDNLKQGAWNIHVLSPSSNEIRYGDIVRIESAFYPGHYLTVSKSSLYLTTAADKSSEWRLLPAPSGG